MLDRRETPQIAPADERRALAVIRRVLAMIVVSGGLLAAATWYKHSTCGCSGGVPYATVGMWAGVVAAVSLAAYVALGLALRRP